MIEDYVQAAFFSESPLTKPRRNNDEGLPVRLSICIDGTGDTPTGSFDQSSGVTSGLPGSIYSIYDMIRGGNVVDDVSGKAFFQHAAYFSGVGTEITKHSAPLLPTSGKITFANADPAIKMAYKGNLYDKATGFFSYCTATGYEDILKNAYEICCYRLQHEEDEIFMFGFSRGAFIVRALSSFLENVGLIKLDALKGDDKGKIFNKLFQQQLQRYTELTTTKKSKTGSSDRSLLNFAKQSPKVRMIGAFDTVKTVFSGPGFLKSLFSGTDFQMDAPRIVDHFRHALALNEERYYFQPSLWEASVGKSEDRYLEAWFFGYHHDIGGGDEEQGLALWPLQWILEGAMGDGLVLNRGMKRYKVLFSGKEYSMDTCGITVKMFDMIDYHTAEEFFKPGFHKPNSYDKIHGSHPRRYPGHLRSLPADNNGRSRVFLHPSTYLLYDTVSTVRDDIAEWACCKDFFQGRSDVLTSSPWWETRVGGQTPQEKPTPVEHLNILVYGRPGTSKASLISHMFGECYTEDGGTRRLLNKGISTSHKINSKLLIPDNKHVHLYYSNGFGSDGNDNVMEVMKFLRDREKQTLENQIHVIWCFLDCNGAEFEKSEKDFLRLDFGDVPVFVITEYGGHKRDPAWKRDGAFREAIASRGKEMDGYETINYTPEMTATGLCYFLLRGTSLAVRIKHASIYEALQKGQRVVTKWKVALALQEADRAYAAWDTFKSEGKETSLTSSQGSSGKGLSWMLIESILGIFDIRTAHDDETIRSILGLEWKILDEHTTGQWDDQIAGDIVLLCLFDTIMAICYAISQRSPPHTDHTKVEYCTEPLSVSGIEAACKSYKSAGVHGQAAKHEKIRALLAGTNGWAWFNVVQEMHSSISKVLKSDAEGNYPTYSTFQWDFN